MRDVYVQRESNQGKLKIRLTNTQRQVLEQAILDGGKVVLSGIDKHTGWNKRHDTAARELHNLQFGTYETHICHVEFVISQSGRDVIKQ